MENMKTWNINFHFHKYRWMVWSMLWVPVSKFQSLRFEVVPTAGQQERLLPLPQAIQKMKPAASFPKSKVKRWWHHTKSISHPKKERDPTTDGGWRSRRSMMTPSLSLSPISSSETFLEQFRVLYFSFVVVQYEFCCCEFNMGWASTEHYLRWYLSWGECSGCLRWRWHLGDDTLAWLLQLAVWQHELQRWTHSECVGQVVCSFSECGSTYTAQLHMHIITVQCYICSAHFTGW